MHEDRTVLGPFHGDGVIELAHKRASARRGQQNRSASDDSFSVQGGVLKKERESYTATYLSQAAAVRLGRIFRG